MEGIGIFVQRMLNAPTIGERKVMSLFVNTITVSNTEDRHCLKELVFIIVLLTQTENLKGILNQVGIAQN